MASVGWKRQYETETLCNFYKVIRLMEDRIPEDEALRAFAKKAKLVAIMKLTQEQIDVKAGTVADDRLNDCAACRKQNGGKCYRDFNPERRCIYERADVKLRVILKAFGEEAKEWIEKAGQLAERELEAKA